MVENSQPNHSTQQKYQGEKYEKSFIFTQNYFLNLLKIILKFLSDIWFTPAVYTVLR